MNEEIRNDEIMETETVELEDVKEGLSKSEWGMIAALMAVGALVFEGGKFVWKKTAKPRGKIAELIGRLGKKDAKDDKEESLDQESSSEKVSKKSEEKKTKDKGKSDK